MINVYDFDKTIYNGDSSFNFYLYCLIRYPIIIFLLPKQFIAFILYKLKIKDKLYFKETFFLFLKYVPDIKETVEKFWIKNIKKIKKWYIENKKKSDVIISASPEFLLKPLIKKLEIKDVIASVVDNNGKFLSNNCYGKEKVIRFKEKYKNIKIDSFYSDSKSDLPMAKIVEKAFLVNKNKVKVWEVNSEES